MPIISIFDTVVTFFSYFLLSQGKFLFAKRNKGTLDHIIKNQMNEKSYLLTIGCKNMLQASQSLQVQRQEMLLYQGLNDCINLMSAKNVTMQF